MESARMQIKCDCGSKNFNFFVALEKDSNYGNEILVCEDCKMILYKVHADIDILAERWEPTEEDEKNFFPLGK